MSRDAGEAWVAANQRYLAAAVAAARVALEINGAPRTNGADPAATRLDQARRRCEALAAAMPAPSALDALCAGFGLSTFERDVLVLCAGLELDSALAPLCAPTVGSGRDAGATFSLALAALPEAHWSALLPEAPLRRWRLIEVGAGTSLATSLLRIDERVLHFLTGLRSFDERLLGLVHAEPVVDLADSHAALAARVATLWGPEGREGTPVAQLCGLRPEARRAVAAAAAAKVGLRLYVLAAHLLPPTPGEVVALARLWAREALFENAALLIEWDDLGNDALRRWNVDRFIDESAGVMMLAAAERAWEPGPNVVSFDLPDPSFQEQRSIWAATLGDAHRLNGQLGKVVANFDLAAPAIRSAVRVAESASSDAPFEEALWDACRAEARPRLDELARRVETGVQWDDLVLPAGIKDTLKQMEAHVRRRAVVYGDWGFGTGGSRGPGITALFVGASGTGKTMAAEVLANALRLDLYRIDLSQVVNKYIGETEKNLRRVFDAAERGGVVLLFDEADALFGKRTQVRDSHDRFANIEVGYLLQRMEAYRGLAILTTNTKDALDAAFLRRLRFVVQFPFPDARHRAEIWRKVFPAAAPQRGLDPERLARLSVSGGNIRNIALHAAFLAADAGEPVGMSHLLGAARAECAKIEKALADSEVAGWT